MNTQKASITPFVLTAARVAAMLTLALSPVATRGEISLASLEVRLSAPQASSSIALCDTTAVIGGNVFDRVNGRWQITGAVPAQRAVAVSEDGSIIAVGTGLHFTDTNNVTVFARSGTNWILQATLLPEANGTNEVFGYSLAISGDLLFVGAPALNVFDAGRGSVYCFRRNGASWNQEARIVPAKADGMTAGAALAVSGQTILIGSMHDGSFTGPRTGVAWVYVQIGTAWQLQQKLQAPGSESGNDFGNSVALDGDTAFVGAPSAQQQGRAFPFARSGSVWTAQQTLGSNPTVNYNQFGSAVAVRGNVAMVGEGSWWNGSVRQGRVLFYERSGGAWTFNKSFVSVGAAAAMTETVAISSKSKTEFYGDSPTNTVEFAGKLRKLLYYPDADATGYYAKSLAAFRYKHLLYGRDSSDAQQRIRARFETAANLYGPAERVRSSLAEQELLWALDSSPTNSTYRDLLLDIYYDRTVGETILGRDLVQQADQARLITPTNTLTGYVIDNEIPFYEAALSTNLAPLRTYFGLLTNGYASNLFLSIFKEQESSRSLQPATFVEGNNYVSVVTNNAPLATGYKDLILLYDLLRERGELAAELASLYIARGTAASTNQAQQLIADAHGFLYLHASFLRSLFPNLAPVAGDHSGLFEAMRGCENAIAALDKLKGVIGGQDNLLGFNNDFLMLVQNYDQATNPFDSFDVFAARLRPAADNPSSPLWLAKSSLQEARDTYNTYHGYLDEIRDQFDTSSQAYETRLLQIVGAYPNTPEYATPENNVGSEIYQQLQSLEIARIRIERNHQQIANLKAKIEIEIDRRGQEHGINRAIQEVYIQYGKEQADISAKISHYEAAQGAANAFAAGIGGAGTQSSFLVGLAAGAVNAGVQAGLSEGKAELEQKKETLAAEQNAEINSLNDQLLDVNSKAAIKTWMLDMSTLVLDSKEAVFLMRQEISRLTALYREKADLEQRIQEFYADVDSRYFADPVHRVRAQQAAAEANIQFAEAQKWLFFMARALEYKWNTAFTRTNGQSVVTSNTLFRLRNADELVNFYNAMMLFNGYNQGLQRDDHFDWFSIREDFLGYRRFDPRTGQALTYQDPDTGETIDAIEAFRRHLRRLKDANGDVRIEFSTVREIPGGSFFRGPRFDTNGVVTSAGLFLDKIKSLQIRLPGNYSGARTKITGELSYGGISFIRNFDVGTFDPERSDRLRNEMTPYNTRYWFYHIPSAQWRSNEALSAPVEMQLTSDPRVPPSVQEIDVFKERSVAASGWILTLFTRENGVEVLDLNALNDIELYFYHYAYVRPR